ncbi:MAG: hypothetical protein KKD28_12355 [Chloroflexi bacterium]|nr:hypothetical protein [Chloroflexota bacterium]MBU1662251.1 hypothetical protein [Chloroflexota bacterium]
MPPPLDLIVLPLARRSGEDQPELPGLYAAAPPRHPARGRSLERLVIHLSLEGSAPLSPKGYVKLMDHLAQTYFKTTGSSTAAMRTVAEWLNEYLLERNLRADSRSMQSIGMLTLIVLRGSYLYLAQSGPTHAFLLTVDSPQHLHDPGTAGRGLGLGRATAIRYRQAEVAPGDVLLISADPPSGWATTTLGDLCGMKLGDLHRRLIHRVGPDLQAALVQIQAGSGKIRLLRPEPVRAEANQVRGEGAPEREDATPPHPAELPAPQPPKPGDLIRPRVAAIPHVESATEAEQPPRSPIIIPALLKIGQAVGGTLQKTFEAAGRLFRRMLPDESLFSIPPAAMAFIAVAVPLIVVTVAAVVYFRSGRGEMYAGHYIQAQYAADQARQLEGANELRSGWNTVLDHLDQAEVYQVTDDSRAMRTYALTVLDSLDGIVRLVFEPAIVGGLPSSTQVTRIVATGKNELYLLNGTNGNVLRAILTDQGYELDSDFICGPVPKPLIVGPLVDILPLSLGDPNNAVIMGMDADGNLMQCISGGQAPLAFPLPPPDMSWGTPTAFAMDATDLYVLDPQTNAVWIYWGGDEYREFPKLFFDEQVPPMKDVIDLTINRDDLFLLHEDGHLTTCAFSYHSFTRCTDPAVFNDLRDGRENGPHTDGAVFSEIQFAPPPDPSLFLLEPDMRAIYHFSMRLAFQRQYRAQNPLPDGPVTAFAVGPNHQAFLAIGNQVYYASLR